MRIGIDLDGVVFDTIGELIRRYNQDYQDNLDKEDIKGWETARYVKCGEEIYGYFKDESFYADLPLMEGALEVMERLDQHHDIVLVSDTPAIAVVNRTRQLETIFPADKFRFMKSRNIIFTARKDLIILDVLLDDKPENIEAFNQTKQGIAVVFDWAYNRHLTDYPRVGTWWEFEQLMKGLEDNLAV